MYVYVYVCVCACAKISRKDLIQYLPPNEVPPQSRKKRSLGPANTSLIETPSPILHKRSRTNVEENVNNSTSTTSAKRPKENSCVDDKVYKFINSTGSLLVTAFCCCFYLFFVRRTWALWQIRPHKIVQALRPPCQFLCN